MSVQRMIRSPIFLYFKGKKKKQPLDIHYIQKFYNKTFVVKLISKMTGKGSTKNQKIIILK